MQPGQPTIAEVKELAAEWDQTHMTLPFKTDAIEPENNIFCGLPFDDIGIVAQAVGMPAKFARELPHDLAQKNLEYLAKHTDILEKGQAVVSHGAVIGVVWNKGIPLLGASAVIDAVEKGLSKANYPWEIDTHSLNPENNSPQFWVNIVEPDSLALDADNDLQKVEMLDKGDPLKGGFSLWHDISGEKDSAVDSFIYRLVCTNGMVAKERGAAWSVSHRELEDRLPARVAHIADFTKQVMERFVHSKHKEITDPAKSAASLARDLKLTAKVRVPFFELVEERTPVSMYDLINCLTEVLNGANIEVKRKYQVSVGGLVSALPQVCGSCHQIVH